MIGYPPGTLLFASTEAGGGFSGRPESITVWVRKDLWPEGLFPRQEFPQHNDHSVKYAVYREDGSFYLEEHRLKYNGDVDTFDLSRT